MADETDDQKSRRLQQTLYCIRAHIDLFFSFEKYGTLEDADHLSEQILQGLIREKWLT